MKSRIEVFIIAFIVWCFLIWPYDKVYGVWNIQGLIIGAIASLVISIIFGKGFTEKPGNILSPRRWFYFLLFIFVFIFYCIKANFQVAYLVIHPELPIKPGIVKIRTRLKSRIAITFLANCITLTPGTLTVEAREEGLLYVHWLEVVTTEENKAGRLIAGKFEFFLQRIFEDI